MENVMFKGMPASPGIAEGKVFVVGKEKKISVLPKPISDADIHLEIAKFENALLKTREEIENIQKHIQTQTGTEHAEIFEAHLLLLEDRMLIEEVVMRLRNEKVCVEYIVSDIMEKYARAFSELEDEYMRERISDIEDVSKRILRKLFNIEKKTLKNLSEPAIIIAHDVSPSDIAVMPKDKALGFATETGSRTSHTAIMARGLEIPAVVGIEHITNDIQQDDWVILDGNRGVIYINPDSFIRTKYEEEKIRLKEFEKELFSLHDLSSKTKDDFKIVLAGNIELPEEVSSVFTYGGEGIGLYRTEFLYLNRKDLPTEEEHYESYKRIAAAFTPVHIIIRTLDLGGDKVAPQMNIPPESNPYMGWRAIRFCLAVPGIFKMQLKGILRASFLGNIKIMYPMVSDVEEVIKAGRLLQDAKDELDAKGLPYDKDIEVGVMIETPAAVMTADIIAPYVKFFSIGTNDLIQYSLAIDRANEKVAYLYKPAHPGVIRMIKNVIDIGHKNGIWVGMCGEMASEPLYSILLIGLGLDQLSVSPIMIPEIKKIIRSTTIQEAKQIADTCLGMNDSEQIESFLKEKLKPIIPKIATDWG
ncbi:phosphoenolpyruvate--protein phosphotransferase [bacterium Unc6]|nr:phosphoenolpyruvate--protein phosphotransferase [bacterium Unc6]